VWAIAWGYVGAAQLLGPYVAIPGSRQSDDVAARYASGQKRFPGAGWGICASPTGGPQGQLQTCLDRDWDGDLSGSPRLVGAKQAASPRSRLLGAPPFDDDAREPSLSPLRLCLWVPRLWSPLVLLGACSPPCPVVLPPQSLIAESQQTRRRPQRSSPSKVVGLLKAQLKIQDTARGGKNPLHLGRGCGRVAQETPFLVRPRRG
jgi:hypothetical protein